MRCTYGILLAALAVVGATGCGGSDGGKQQAPTVAVQNGPSDPDAGQAGAAAPKLEGPAAAVYEFLDAVKHGNDDKAGSMLTALARKKTAEKDMVVAPPGSDTARFEVGQIEYLPDQRAKVDCTWTDQEADGQMRTDHITWVLRQEPEGWRVGGMAATVFPDQPPVLFNFEDPEDMLRQQQQLQEEMQRRAAAASSQAQRPETPHTAQDPIRR